jgi:2-phosphoglycerate kinase
MNTILLIGGSPTSGKSHTARALANAMHMPWISTDTIREQMRKIVRRADYPHLFAHEQQTVKMAQEFLTKNTVKQIVRFVNHENREVWAGVKALVEGDYVWGNFIVEGVAILPAYVKKLSVKKKTFKAVFLIDDNIDRVRETIFTRGLWDDADKYPDGIKEKEVEWVVEYNRYLARETKRYGFPLVRVGDRGTCLDRITRLFKR